MIIGDQKKIRAHLSQINNDLLRRFEAFEIKATQLLEYSQGGAHLSFTTHGISHIRRVELTYDWLMGPDDIRSLSGGEAFCLLCATFCHDLFMIPRFLGDEVRSRGDHAQSAASELRRLQSQLGLSASEATFIGEVVRGHHVETILQIKEDQVLGSDRVRLRMLGACLSMADICHADESRAPGVVFKYLEMNEDSSRHWKRHMQIAGINRQGSKIAISAISFSEEGKVAVEDYGREIQKQLSRVNPYFYSQLLAIDGVQVSVEELESEFDQKLAFKTDTSAILDMLVSGVYQQVDVFVRELIQNALDATYIENARCVKNGIPYSAKINVCEFRGAAGELLGLRVDDNGVGMGVSEVKDTLLWIGQSQNSKEAVQEILKTTGKSLIANFGIGLLSCFRVSTEIVIRTQKGESGRSFEVRIGGYGERVSMKEVLADIGGTSILVRLKPEYATINAHEASKHYCRMISAADVYLSKCITEKVFIASRRSALADALESGAKLENLRFGEGSVSIQGDGYYCRITIPWDKGINGILTAEGSLIILNDGIYVCEEKTGDWLPESLNFCSGIINFAAKSIDLPVSRDAIVENAKYLAKTSDLEKRVISLFEKIANESQKRQFRDLVAVIFAYALAKTEGSKKDALIRELSSLNVQLHGGAQVSLAQIVKLKPTHVYITYQEGSYVDKLGRMDGAELWYKRDQNALMQAELAHAAGDIVIEAVRADRALKGFDKLKEKDVIEVFLRSHSISVIDLLESTPFAGNLRSLSIPRSLRSIVGRKIKFVEPGVQISKIGWDLGDEVWLNVSNPKIRKLYDRIKTEDLSDMENLALRVIISLIDNEFDVALNLCLSCLRAV